jgi:hypothetical protein
MLVTDEKGQVTGAVSLGELAANVAESLSGEALNEISKPAH